MFDVYSIQAVFLGEPDEIVTKLNFLLNLKSPLSWNMDVTFYVQKRNVNSINWKHLLIPNFQIRNGASITCHGTYLVAAMFILLFSIATWTNWTSQSKSDYHASRNQTFVQPASSKNTIQRLRLVR